MKICPTCKKEKPNDSFYFFRKKPHGHCKECHRIHSRKSALKRQYGLSVEDYNKMAENQGNVCAICSLPGHTNNRQKYPLYVDHDHITGKVRELLCANCNTMLGHLENCQNLIDKMQEYISKHKP